LSLPDIPPARPYPEAMEFLLTRRSRPARTLTLPVPTRDALRPILRAAVRVPDHGKLEPWRLIVLEKGALTRSGGAGRRTRRRRLGMDEGQLAKGVAQFADSHLAVVVVKVPRATDKIPETEQVLSSGRRVHDAAERCRCRGMGSELADGLAAVGRHVPAATGWSCIRANGWPVSSISERRVPYRPNVRARILKQLSLGSICDLFCLHFAALSQMSDARFLRVVGLGVALALALLIAVYMVLSGVAGWLLPDHFALPWVGQVDWIGAIAGWGGFLLFIVLSVFLMVPVAALSSPASVPGRASPPPSRIAALSPAAARAPPRAGGRAAILGRR
jgi:hypothetical protein